MKLKLLWLVALFASIQTFSQDFGVVASGIKVKNTIYNISSNSQNTAINPSATAQNFDGVNLGSFIENSSCGSITGAEVKTFKNASANVCNAVLNWRVYPVGAPSGVFNTVSLTTVSNCDLGVGTYFDGLGSCNAGDQKWKDYALNINFINGLGIGNYVLETFFTNDGSNVNTNTCETTKTLDNAGLYYKATFSIAASNLVITSATASPATVCDGNNVTLTAVVAGGTTPYSYAWSGPNGFTSAASIPIFVATSASVGIYSVIVTDACGVVSASQTTNGLNVTPRIIPTFETLLSTYCRKVYPPLPPILPILPVPPLVPDVILPNTSTEGIDGTWSLNSTSSTPIVSKVDTDPVPNGANPPLVVTTRYYFYPNNSECGSNTFVDIDIRRNTLPTFVFPLTYCVGDVVPNLPLNSSNSVGGTWSNVLGAPVVKINTSVVGTFQYNFSPNPGLCALQRAYIITITPKQIPLFTLPTFVCAGGTVPVLNPFSEDNPPILGNWTPSIVSATISQTYTFNAVGTCVANKVVTIDVKPVITPTFDAIAPICKNRVASALPTQSTNVPAITGTWSGAINTSISGTQTFTFTPTSDPCATTATLDVQIIEPLDPTFDEILPICKGTAAIDTPQLPTNSTNLPPIIGTWSPLVINTNASGSYTFTPSGNICANTKTITITVKEPTIPTFDPIAPICIGDAFPAFPVSTNNPIINGTWSPTPPLVAIVAGSFTYTFSPTPGQCASPTTFTFTVRNKIPTNIPAVPNICIGTTPAPDLPQPTNVPIVSGTWNPLTIDTTTAGTFPYTFTPNGAHCADVQTIQVTITNPTVPIFTFAPLCQFSTANPDPLPLSSNNVPPITGTWTPATIDTNNIGISTYLFTPDGNQCASAKSFDVNILEKKTPIFNNLSICQGATTPTALPTTSLNGISGSWSTVLDVNTLGDTIYTFNPNSNECAFSGQVTVTVTPKNIDPTFVPFPILCKNTIGYSLPTSSTNSPQIEGIWSPALSTANTGITEYTFTPNAGQCAKEFKVNITVKPEDIVPTFNSLGNICNVGPVPPLPNPSTNNPPIFGTWFPASINQNVLGISSYTFTPNTNQCAVSTTFEVNIVNTGIVPTFAAISPICKNSVAPLLPQFSNNSVPISGNWSPSNVIDTSVASATPFIYTFTPNPNQCAVSTTVEITIVTESIIPIFTTIPSSICKDNSPYTLPLVSNNSGGPISGTWNPAIVTTGTVGLFSSTFTPANNQCALPITINVQITAPTNLSTFNQINVCQGLSTVPAFPQTSLEGYNGTWSQPTITNTNIGTYTINFIPNGNQCALPGTLTVNVFAPNITPTFTQIPPICQGNTAPNLPLVSLQGINGNWSPAINTSIVGPQTILFTPTVGQCGNNNGQMVITITPPTILSTFNVINVCQNVSNIPSLPTSSLEGKNGIWTPAFIDNSVVGQFIYNFTPDANQCAQPGTVIVNVTAPTIVPTFAQIAPICQGEINPASFLNTSENGITGAWNGPINTSAVSSPTYTFVPIQGQCAVSTTMTIQITPPTIDLTFPTVSNICLNGTAPSLPQPTNVPAIQGVWTSSINTSAAGTTIYQFNPNAGKCAKTGFVSVTIDAQKLPTFSLIASICKNGTAPTLNNTSINNIIGDWLPAAINTSTAGTLEYVFTARPNQCAQNTSIFVTIDEPVIVPTFNTIANICQNTIAIALPEFSTNAVPIRGTWFPKTINTAVAGPSNYTFTPIFGTCAKPATIVVNIDAPLVTTFNPIVNTSICLNGAVPVLPTISTNGIVGTWTPTPIVSNTIIGATVYTFNPSSGVCATKPTVTINVFEPTDVPTFSFNTNLCSGTTPIVLPLNSDNGFAGTWQPNTINNSQNGTYVFTPTFGLCAKTKTVDVKIIALPSGTINASCDNFIYKITVAALNNSFNESTATYTWKNESNVTIAGQTTNTLDATSIVEASTQIEKFPLNYTVTITSPENCVSQTLPVVIEGVFCQIQKGISPDNDGLNDYMDLSAFEVGEMRIYNRYGMKVYSKSNYKKEWTGQTDDGLELPDGTYFYNIDFKNQDTKTGWIYINRRNN